MTKNMTTGQKMQPLKGTRVLDLTRVLAGPLCTQTLGLLGAEVIKIEGVGDGDEMRHWPPFKGDTGTAFLAYNRGKKSISLDLKKSESRDLVRRLIAKSDVVIESGSTGAMDRLGLGYEDARKLRPDLVYCSISGFGRVGPLKDAKGYDLMLQAFSGIMAMTGEAGGEPVRSPFSPIDQVTGHHAVVGILGALLQRAQTREGALVEVSLLETATHLVAYHLQAFWETKKLPERIGCGHPSLVPYQPFETADKPILIGVANDALWRSFCREFDIAAVGAEDRFATNRARVQNRAEAVALVQEVIGNSPSETLITRLIAAGIPCSPINSLGDLAEHAQLDALGMFQQSDHPTLGLINVVAPPITFNRTKADVGSAAPTLGEHTREVLADLGCSPEEVAGYLESGIAFAAPARPV